MSNIANGQSLGLGRPSDRSAVRADALFTALGYSERRPRRPLDWRRVLGPLLLGAAALGLGWVLVSGGWLGQGAGRNIMSGTAPVSFQWLWDLRDRLQTAWNRPVGDPSDGTPESPRREARITPPTPSVGAIVTRPGPGGAPTENGSIEGGGTGQTPVAREPRPASTGGPGAIGSTPDMRVSRVGEPDRPTSAPARERAPASVATPAPSVNSPVQSRSAPAPLPSAPATPSTPGTVARGPDPAVTPAPPTAAPASPTPPLEPAPSAPAVPSTSENLTGNGDPFERAVQYHKEGQYDQALAAYRNVLELNPLDVETHNNLGVLYQGEGLLPDAIKEFQRAVFLDERYVTGRTNLGAALLSAGRPDEAVDQFRSVLEIEPANIDAMVNLALALKTAGRLDEARGRLLRALEHDAQNAPSHYNLALLYDEAGETAKAITHYQEFLRYSGAEYAHLVPGIRDRLDELGGPRSQ